MVASRVLGLTLLSFFFRFPLTVWEARWEIQYATLLFLSVFLLPLYGIRRIKKLHCPGVYGFEDAPTRKSRVERGY